MADDVTVSGASTDIDVATDDDGSGNHMQIIKLAVSANGDRTLAPVDGTYGQGVDVKRTVRSSTATVSEVNASATVVTLVASNANRLGVGISNDSSASLYLKLGSTATADDYTVKLAQDDYYEPPAGYTGIITGIWSSATGSARITELT